MKTKLYLIICLIIFMKSELKAQNIHYQSWVTGFTATGNCNELGDEEYTWYGYFKDNDYTTETSTGCKQKTANGSTSYTGNFGLRSRNNTIATTITARIRAWEDDGGSRCSYDSGGVNGDDCYTNLSNTYSLSNPVEYEYNTTSSSVGNGNFNMTFTFEYRYSVEHTGIAVDNLSETFTTSGHRGFWGTRGGWASDGLDCAASGTIAHNQNSVLKTTATDKSSVTFKWKVSSATGDYLKVFVNGVLDEQITGETSWVTKTINLTESVNTIEWQYIKDSSGVNGLDRGFVDAISFVDATLSTSFKNLDAISIHPNPVTSTLNIKGLNAHHYNLDIYGIEGKKVKSIKNVQKTTNVSSLSKGLYLIKVYDKSGYKTFKMLKK